MPKTSSCDSINSGHPDALGLWTMQKQREAGTFLWGACLSLFFCMFSKDIGGRGIIVADIYGELFTEQQYSQ